MKRITTTHGYESLVDDEDYEFLSRYRWCAHGGTGRKRPARRTSASEGRKLISLVHHIIKPPAGMVVDHIDGDPWNNQRANLRVCTNAQNMKNVHTQKLRSGRSKGTFTSGSNFGMQIMDEGRMYRFGGFKTLKEAALAYDAAALALHGEYACINYPDAGTVPCHPDVLKVIRPLRVRADPSELSRLFASGMSGAAVARATGISGMSASRWASRLGFTLKSGRPPVAPAQRIGIAA